LTKYLIGAGGWAYFNVPGLNSLEAYSRVFNFVEVNSTFYEVPNLKTVELWRRRVPEDFEFSVRLNRKVSHKIKLEPVSEAFDLFDYTKHICRILRSEIIVLQTPPTIDYNREKIRSIKDFFGSLNLEGIRIVWEVRRRGKALPKALLNVMQEYNVIHCVDLSREEPAYESDQIYTRLFGKGEKNIYQFSDEDMMELDRRTKGREYEKVSISFHNVKMYKDAARFKVYKETKKLMPITKYTGLQSLRHVLKEDAKFPASKEALIKDQGWKLVDLTKEKRIHASELLQRIPKKVYRDVNEVIEALNQIRSDAPIFQ